MTHMIDGKALAARLRADIQQAVAARSRAPGLAVIQIGEDPASDIYVQNKEKACAAVGILSTKRVFPATVSQETVCAYIQACNQDLTIDGILLQSPVPSHLHFHKLIEIIDPAKDVDGFHPYNAGRLMQGNPALRPCTPWGIIQLLQSIAYPFSQGQTTMVGASPIVGRPMMLELLFQGATPTVCHHLTENLQAAVERADLLIVAIGKPSVIQPEWIKRGAVVIDVGINRIGQSVRGDIDFAAAQGHVAAITPVPGGVGPMTITALLQNTLLAAQWRDRA